MPIVKIMLKKHRQRADGTFPVVVYLYEKKAQYIYSGYSVRGDQFKDGRVVKHSDALIINSKVEEIRAEVLKCCIPGVGYIPGGQQAQAPGSFSAYVEKRGKEFTAAERIETGHRYLNVAREMAQMAGRDVYFHEITQDWIRKYAEWCRLRGNTQNTVGTKLRALRTLYNQAAMDDLCPPINPFKKFKIKVDPVQKQKLSDEQLAALEGLDLANNPLLNHARNAFLISFYAQGMRFENVCTLKWDHIRNEHIEYQMNKGRKWRAIAIHEKLQNILALYRDAGTPYILPFIKAEVTGPADLRKKKGSANAVVNARLKVIGLMAGILQPLKFHEARHTFSMRAKKKGVSTDVIKDALGHSNIAITEAYLKALDDDHINQAVSVVWS